VSASLDVLIRRAGGRLVRQRGKHRVYELDGKVLVIPRREKEIKKHLLLRHRLEERIRGM
jgi:predicted RNA binding protein YcfA (HicA-like mRNA interferase family)